MQQKLRFAAPQSIKFRNYVSVVYKPQKNTVSSPHVTMDNILWIFITICPSEEYLIEFQWFCFVMGKCGKATKLSKERSTCLLSILAFKCILVAF
jgi:hypothetical protein